MDYQVKDNNCSFFYHCEWLLRQHESGHFLTYGHFMSRPTALHCRTPDLYWHFVIVYMTYQFKRNPNTMPVSKIICTCTTIFLKFYNKCVQGLKLRKYFRGQVGPHQINFGSPHNLLGSHQAHSAPATSIARCPMAEGPLKAPRSPGINGVKSCILAISWQQNWPFRN